MTIKFKLSNDIKLYEIKADNLLLIKVSLLEKYGNGSAIYLFQKVLRSSLLFYVPTERDLQNLVKGNYKSYVSANRTEITDSINSIKEI